MKLRKIFAAIAASAVIMSVSAANCSAVEDGKATYCFDTADKLADWQTYGNVAETGFAFTHTTKKSNNGAGCITVSVKNSSELSDGYGGAFIEASSLGLDDFGSCTISMSVLACEGAEAYCDSLALYTDGIMWAQESAENINSKTWTEISLVVPTGADNARVGFTIPTFKEYSGDVVYIDDFTITDPNGNIVANVGDYQFKNISSEDTVSKGTNIVLTILLVLLIVAIVGAIGYVIMSAMKKFH